jgi:hypothetical protein
MTTIKTCTYVPLPDHHIITAADLARQENAVNTPTISERDLPPGMPLAKIALAGITGKFWKPGRTLRVRFLDGNSKVQERLQPFAHIWSQFANIKFEFGDDPNAEIRISFKQAGSWSYLGTDSLVIPKDQPTMNYGWLTTSTGNDEYSRVVTHEFGHALGMVHEHQNPAATIPWNKQAVYDYYQGPPNNWTKAQVDTNLFTRYSADITKFSEFDRESIMLYPIPAEFVTDPTFVVGWNKALSAIDKQFIGGIYPLQPKPVNELTIGGPSIKASIGTPGEIDVYTFVVQTAGRYSVETLGRLDTTLALFGPNDETRFIAKDDDSGRGLNARIAQQLTSGTYTVRVRHFSEKKVGEYEIRVMKS